MPELVASRYNFAIGIEDGAIVYNTNSGALMRLGGNDGRMLGQWLMEACGEPAEFELDTAVVEDLRREGFLVSSLQEELERVRERYWKARTDTPVVLTITTTQDCNLGCFYCYEERSGEQLEARDVAGVVKLARERLERRGRRSLHVDWYGGEPLLNIAFLEVASLALQEMCREMGVGYQASVISNGTQWPEDVAGFVRRHQIRQVQVSLDGMREKHNRSRRYRPGYGEAGQSSFDAAVAGIDALLEATRVDLRLNLGRHNVEDAFGIVEMARERGWFGKPYPVVIQPAKLAAFTETCGFLRPREFNEGEFAEIRARLRAALRGEALMEEVEAPDGLPLPRTSVCAALAEDSVVVGADGLEYRCGLQVGQKERATGKLSDSPFRILGQYQDARWWAEFDPTRGRRCEGCSFLPVCLGGCPHKHLQEDEAALEAQSEYWRRNLPRLMAEKAGARIHGEYVFTEREQFR